MVEELVVAQDLAIEQEGGRGGRSRVGDSVAERAGLDDHAGVDDRAALVAAAEVDLDLRRKRQGALGKVRRVGEEGPHPFGIRVRDDVEGPREVLPVGGRREAARDLLAARAFARDPLGHLARDVAGRRHRPVQELLVARPRRPEAVRGALADAARDEDEREALGDPVGGAEEPDLARLQQLGAAQREPPRRLAVEERHAEALVGRRWIAFPGEAKALPEALLELVPRSLGKRIAHLPEPALERLALVGAGEREIGVALGARDERFDVGEEAGSGRVHSRRGRRSLRRERSLPGGRGLGGRSQRSAGEADQQRNGEGAQLHRRRRAILARWRRPGSQG